MPKGIYVRTREHGIGYKPENHIMETRICDPECGCDQTFECETISDKRFIHGHNSKGKNNFNFNKQFTLEEKLNLSKIMTGRYPSKETLEKNSGKNNHGYKLECHDYETRYCKCKCGGTFICLKRSDQKFLPGHNIKGIFTKKGKDSFRYGKPCSKGVGHGKVGRRPDLNNQYFRSTWESNFARSLNWEGIPFEYECKRFPLTRADGTKYTYCPDFHIPGTSIWYEIKGYMGDFAIETIKLFKEQYSEETLIVISKEEYKKMTETYKDLIPNWEK